jgi:transposase
MREDDKRKLSRTTLEQLRIEAVKQVLGGESPEVVTKALGFSRNRIYHWLAEYKAGGFEALKNSERHGGRPPLLDWIQIKQIYYIIKDETPEQYEFSFALWTIELVREVIRRKFNIKMSAVSTWRTLRSLGLTPQRPKRKAFQQNPAAVRKFMSEDYPKIREFASSIGASIYWGDEASVRSDYHSGTTWGLRGQTPYIKDTGARFSVNMLSAVCGNGQMRFMLTEKRCNAELFILFLQRLIKGQDKPIVLIVDGCPVHKAKKVKKFIDSTEGKLWLFFLPGYSPELNPDELVWGQIKHHIIGKQTVTGPDQFKAIVGHALRSLSHKISTIAAFFKKPALQYINA